MNEDSQSQQQQNGHTTGSAVCPVAGSEVNGYMHQPPVASTLSDSLARQGDSADDDVTAEAWHQIWGEEVQPWLQRKFAEIRALKANDTLGIAPQITHLHAVPSGNTLASV